MSDAQIAIPGGGTTTIAQFMSDTFNYQYTWIGPVIGILVAWTVGALPV